MTTIAAIQGADFAVIGADSKSSSEDGSCVNIPDGKIFTANGIVIAAAGAVRGINILQHDFNPPKLGRHNPDRYITRTFIPAMRKAFASSGYEMSKQDSTVAHDNIFIIAIERNLYRIEDDYSWERVSEGMYVAGSGERLALGAMDALGARCVTNVIEAEIIVRKAIKIASDWDAYTGGTITTTIL